MIKRTGIFIFLLLLVIAILAFIKYQQIQQGMAMMAGSMPPPASVEVIEVKHQQWQPRVSAVGTLTAREGIDVRNEVEGIIEKIHIESGQRVAKGDLLVSLNSDIERADLDSFRAQEALALTQYKRSERMWKKRTVSEADFDNARASLDVANANVAQIKARIARKSIRAAFDGVLGIKYVSSGQYVAAGTMLVSLQDYSVLYVDFSVPEKFLPELATGLDVNLRVSAYPEQNFSAIVKAVDAKVNEGTRNINVRAQMDNEENFLRPGMYADIDLMMDQAADRIVVPATAIVYSSFGNALFIVEKNAKGDFLAQRIQVETGEQRGDQVAILSGLKGAELVVQAGANKLKNNSPVSINEINRLRETINEVH